MTAPVCPVQGCSGDADGLDAQSNLCHALDGRVHVVALAIEHDDDRKARMSNALQFVRKGLLELGRVLILAHRIWLQPRIDAGIRVDAWRRRGTSLVLARLGWPDAVPTQGAGKMLSRIVCGPHCRPTG